jgi:hypothetical protein
MEPRDRRSQHTGFMSSGACDSPHHTHPLPRLLLPQCPRESAPIPCAANPCITPQHCLFSTRNQVHLGMRTMKMRHLCVPAMSNVDTVPCVRPATRIVGSSSYHLNGPGPDPESDVVKPSGHISPTWAKAQYYIPSLQWIPNYSLSL